MSFILYSVGTAVLCIILYVAYTFVSRQSKAAEFKRKEKKEFAKDGTQWKKSQHEYYVERFYGTGVTEKHDFHGGYLNFGYWVDANKDYIKASEGLLSQVADPVGLGKDSRLLDIACGMGAQDIFYYNKYKPEHIDMLEATLTHHIICKKRIEESGLEDRLAAHYGSATQIPFDENSFTHVFSIEGGVHYRYRKNFFKETFRVLKPNGWMSLADFAMPTPPRNFIENFFGRICSSLWNAPLENWCSPEVFKKRVEEAGFVDVEVKDIGKNCIPGYYEESIRPEILKELSKIRGWFTTYILCRILDELILWAFNQRLLTEVLVHARKPE